MWHWVVGGALAGVVLGVALILSWSDQRLGGPGFISQGEFERELNLPPVMDKPRLRWIVVHHRSQLDLVSLQRLDVVRLDYQPLLLAAPRPYRPVNGAWDQGAVSSVRDYLSRLSAVNPKLSFQTSWWEWPPLLLTLCGAAGVLTIGGIWPALLRLVAGNSKPKDFKYDLERFGHGTADDWKKSPEEGHLEKLEAELVAALELAPAGGEAGDSPLSTAPVIRQLSATTLASVPAEVQEQQKEYGGEFYPVEKPGARAFSLVELLVVLAIILILLALLLPTVRTVRLHVQTVQCIAQLDQLGKALQSYCNSNQGWLPAWSGWHTWPPGGSDDSIGPAWTVELISQIGKPDSPVYNCPSFPGPQRCRNYFLAAQWSGRSNRNTMKLTDVTMTGRFVLAGDKTQRGLYPPPFGTSEHLSDDADPDDHGDTMPVLAWPWDPGGFYMHREGNNILFDDMHVATYSNFDPLEMTFNPHRMENWADVTPN